MADQTEKRLSWLAFVYDSAIKYGVFRPADVVTHATPEVLANKLPTELLIRIFEVAFDAGKLTAEGILNGVAPPSTLVKHIPANVLWEVVRDAASRHGIAAVSANVPKTGKTPLRSWITEVLANGLEREIFTAADVTRNIPPGEWVKDVPLEVVAKMIASATRSLLQTATTRQTQISRHSAARTFPASRRHPATSFWWAAHPSHLQSRTVRTVSR